MAAKVFLKGIRLGLIFFFLLSQDPSLLVSGQSSTTNTMSSVPATTVPTLASTSASSSSSAPASTSSTALMPSSTNGSATPSSSSSSNPTSPAMTSTTVPSVNTMSTTAMQVTSVSSNSSPPSTNVSWTMAPVSLAGLGSNGTAWNMTMLSCRSFICNYTECNTMYNNKNASACPTGKNFCQLMASDDMRYVVGCTTICATPCDNITTVNCSKGCCNTTNCLTPIFASMMSTNVTVTTMMPSSTKAPTTTTMAPTATVSTGKYCHKGTCSSKVDCYKDFTVSSMCLSTLMHCELKKETSGTTVTWTAGCTKDCSTATWCTASTPTCTMECCNATTNSCLKLTGNLNVPSSATRGQRLPSELLLTAFLACLLSFTWLM